VPGETRLADAKGLGMTQRDTAKQDRVSGLLRAVLVVALALSSTACGAAGAGGGLASALGAPKAPSALGKVIGQSGKAGAKGPLAKTQVGGKSPGTSFDSLVRDNSPLLDMVDPKNPTFNGRRGNMTFPAEDAMARAALLEADKGKFADDD
jgi:hypothetical protein